MTYHQECQEIIRKIAAGDLEHVYYTAGTYAYSDGRNYYNPSGQQLRNPNEYNRHTEGYTPLGDE